MQMNFEVAASWSSRSSSSTTSSGLSREESFRRQAAIMNSSRSSSSTTSSGASREESFRRQAGIIVNQLNKGVEQAKIDYMNAQSRGDQAAMNRAANQAEDLRKQGATLGANEDTAATKALKNYYEQSGIKVAISTRSVDDLNKGIYQAKNDYAWAKANNDQAGMAAASQLASNFRALGGTISADASLEDAKRQAYASKSDSTSNTTKDSTWDKVKSYISTGLDFMPIIGNIKSGFQTVTGKDPITGQSLSTKERVIEAVGIIGGGYVKAGGKIVNKADDLIETIVDAKKVEQGVVNSRPTWRQSEKDAATQYPNYDVQKSFKDGQEVPYGTKGSSRPDLYVLGNSIEIKNYNVTSSEGRARLVNNVTQQVNKRITDLPPNTTQSVIIDVRGQNVSNSTLKDIKDQINKNSNTQVQVKFVTE